MKKLFCVLLLFIGIIFAGSAQEIEKSATALHKDAKDGISTVYSDATKATATVYNDAKNATVAVYPDAKGAVSTLYADGKKAIDYLVPKVEAVITSLAQGLKTTSAEVWRILVYKQVALAISATVYSLLALLVIVAYFIGLSKVLSVIKNMNGYWSDSQTAFAIVGGVLSLISLVVIGHNIPIMVNGYFVPEAGALNEAVNLTKDLIKAF